MSARRGGRSPGRAEAQAVHQDQHSQHLDRRPRRKRPADYCKIGQELRDHSSGSQSAGKRALRAASAFPVRSGTPILVAREILQCKRASIHFRRAAWSGRSGEHRARGSKGRRPMNAPPRCAFCGTDGAWSARTSCWRGDAKSDAEVLTLQMPSRCWRAAEFRSQDESPIWSHASWKRLRDCCFPTAAGARDRRRAIR